MKNDYFPLSEAHKGKEYIIKYINSSSINPDRYSGYGILPDAKIKKLFSSPSGNPSAYEIMGAVIALRTEDSQNIYITDI